MAGSSYYMRNLDSGEQRRMSNGHAACAQGTGISEKIQSILFDFSRYLELVNPRPAPPPPFRVSCLSAQPGAAECVFHVVSRRQSICLATLYCSVVCRGLWEVQLYNHCIDFLGSSAFICPFLTEGPGLNQCLEVISLDLDTIRASTHANSLHYLPRHYCTCFLAFPLGSDLP